jgi:predicted membrane protein
MSSNNGLSSQCFATISFNNANYPHRENVTDRKCSSPTLEHEEHLKRISDKWVVKIRTVSLKDPMVYFCEYGDKSLVSITTMNFFVSWLTNGCSRNSL